MHEIEDVADVIRATAINTEEDIRDLQNDEEMTRGAFDLLSSRRNDAYEAALAALRENTRDWWAETLARLPDELDEDEEPATADADGLRSFINAEVLPWFSRKQILQIARWSASRRTARRSTPIDWSGSAATRCISTGSWNGHSQCYLS